MSPTSPGSSGPRAEAEERRGIFGVETEYAVLYLPDDPADRAAPAFELIEEILFQALLVRRKAAVSSGLKGGYFLENGGLVHLEVYLRTQADTPILEASTPECRSPRDLLVYQRAFDEILTQVSVDSRGALRQRGFAGRIAFGKNNRDARGVGYGCHENFLVREEVRVRDRAVYFLGAPLLVLLLLPSVLFLLGVILGAILCTVAGRAFPEVRSRLLRWGGRRFPGLKGRLRAAYFILMNALLLPPITVYSLLLRAAAFRPFQRDLTSFLVTRQVFAGSGNLDLRAGRWEIAQRPRLTATLGEIVMFGKYKTIYDLKGLLYDPLALFRRERKLTVTLGDSNLSDHSFLLKVGTTALVIEMIEAGVEFADLRLRQPVQAFRAVSREGPWKELAVLGEGGESTPGRLTASEIQRRYLRRAQEHYAARPEGRLRHQEILDLWEEALTDLADGPGLLSGRLDWAAKKALLDRAVFGFGSWSEFLAWGHLLARAPADQLASSRSLEELSAGARGLRGGLFRWRVARALRRGAIDPARFAAARELYYQAQKIDLRYHELGEDAGYARRLEEEGLLSRLTTPEEVARAVSEPPPDTRARIRGYYISLGQTPESIRANWGEVEIAGGSRSIPLPDPFEYRIPTD